MALTYIIIAITVVVSIMAFSNTTLFYRLALNPYDIIRKRQWWRLLTHGLVHGDYTHLLINMLVFWSFGSSVERIFDSMAASGIIINGSFWFIFLYLGAMIISSIRDVFEQQRNPMYNSIGASGAVSAMVFTSIFFAPWSKIYLMAIVPIPAILFGAFYLWYEHRQAQQNSTRINHRAHIYGAIFGFVLPILMEPSLLIRFFNQLVTVKF